MHGMLTARLRKAMVGVVALVAVGLAALPASAATPQRSTFTFHPVNPDLFDEEGNTQHCDFPVVGEWDVVGQETDFVDQTTGNPTRTVLFFHIVGTLSNPESGKSVPDRRHDRFTIYFAPDGSVTKALEEEDIQNPLLPVHAHFELDADENILKDVGHEYLSYNKHPFSIQALCDALA